MILRRRLTTAELMGDNVAEGRGRIERILLRVQLGRFVAQYETSPEDRHMATRVDQIQAIPLFSGLAHADLQFLAGQMDEVSIPAGTVLITEGAGTIPCS
jgi:hypothetical protein